MHTDGQQLRQPSPESLEAGYETSTVNVRGLVYFVIGLILTAAVVHVGIWFVLMGYQHVYELSERPRTGLTGATLPGPPAPRIQPSQPDDPMRVPAADLQHMFQQEDEFFDHELGWKVNRQTHVQTEIPAEVIDQVIRDETDRQRQGSASQSAGRCD